MLSRRALSQIHYAGEGCSQSLSCLRFHIPRLQVDVDMAFDLGISPQALCNGYATMRETAPDGPFHLILCRNVAFTYFDDALQKETLHTITERLVPGGALVIGAREALPGGVWGLEPWARKLGV